MHQSINISKCKENFNTWRVARYFLLLVSLSTFFTLLARMKHAKTKLVIICCNSSRSTVRRHLSVLVTVFKQIKFINKENLSLISTLHTQIAFHLLQETESVDEKVQVEVVKTISLEKKDHDYECFKQLTNNNWIIWCGVMFKIISLEVKCLWLAMTNTIFHHLMTLSRLQDVCA